MALDLDRDPPGGDRAAPFVLARPDPPRGWRERLESLADATGVTPARLVGGAVLLALALAAGWWLLRPPPAPAELSLPYAATSVTAAGAVSPRSTASSEPTELVVHVAGAVARPGVHRLAPGARVVDAVDAAGGLAGSADQARINLAAPLSDGERVYVPAVGEPSPPPLEQGDAGAGSGGASARGGPLDLNTASQAELEELPGVGPATATAIIEHREAIGGFTSVDQLLDVRGIGDAKLDELRTLVRV